MGRTPRRPAAAAWRTPVHAAGRSPRHAVLTSRMPMLAYGDARVTRRRHNRHRHRHHRGQGGSRRRGRSRDRAGADSAPASGAGSRPAGARRRRGVAAGSVGGTGPAGARPEVRAVAVAAMVPSLTAVDAAGRPVTPGLLYGDGRGRVPGAERTGPAAAGGGRGRRVSALDGRRSARRGRILAGAGGGQPRSGGRGGDRLRHGRHGVPPVRRDRLEPDGMRRARRDRRADAAGGDDRSGGRAGARDRRCAGDRRYRRACASRSWPAPITTARCW